MASFTGDTMDFTKSEPLEKGWSVDKKYCVTGKDGKKYLLRISPIEQYDRKKAMFEMTKWVAALGVPMCVPVEFGVNDEGVYVIQSWIEGVDAEEVIPDLTLREQYAYGLEAGRILKVIHSIPAPPGIEDWESRFGRKIDRKVKAYLDCPVKFEGARFMEDYINRNRHTLLKDRPQCYQHGDYHIGNMMISGGKLYIIDFDRDDFGDPWEEFNRIVWCAQKSPAFASGMVDGYFDGNVPYRFWQSLALYVSANMISSLPWALPFGDDEVKTMLNQAREVLYWYDNMKTVVPKWYTEGKKENKMGITIKYLQEYIKSKDFNPAAREAYFMKLTEEVGELSRAKRKNLRPDEGNIKNTLDEELWDVIYYALAIANLYDIDLEKVIPLKEEINNQKYNTHMVFKCE